MPYGGSVFGFGENTVGAGTGGGVTSINISNLNSSGPGSLRAFCEYNGRAEANVQITGVIDLDDDQIEMKGEKTLVVLGTGHGLQVINGRMRLIGNDIILRGLQVIGVPPDMTSNPSNPTALNGNNIDNRDGISIGKSGEVVRDVWVDSNFTLWTGDEGIAVWGDVERVTISHNMICEPLESVGHSEGNHSMGLLTGGPTAFPCSGLLKFGNLFLHCRYRSPSIQDGTQEAMLWHNLMVNPGVLATNHQSAVTSDVRNNVYISGVDTSRSNPMLRSKNNSAAIYVEGNTQDGNDIVLGGPGAGASIGSPGFTFPNTGYPVITDTRQYVLDTAGPDRTVLADHILRCLELAENNTGRILVTMQDVYDIGGLDYVHPNSPPPPPPEEVITEFVFDDPTVLTNFIPLDPNFEYEAQVIFANDIDEGVASDKTAVFTPLAPDDPLSATFVGLFDNSPADDEAQNQLTVTETITLTAGKHIIYAATPGNGSASHGTMTVGGNAATEIDQINDGFGALSAWEVTTSAGSQDIVLTKPTDGRDTGFAIMDLAGDQTVVVDLVLPIDASDLVILGGFTTNQAGGFNPTGITMHGSLDIRTDEILFIGSGDGPTVGTPPADTTLLGLRITGAAAPVATNNPEDGLTLTSSFAVGEYVSPNTQVIIDEAATFSISGDSFTGNGGVGFEIGGSNLGLYFGYAANGDLILRAGDGADDVGTDPEHSRIIVPAASLPTGAGTWTFAVGANAEYLDLYWYDINADTVEVFGPATIRNASADNWANSGSGTYLNTAVSVTGSELTNPTTVVNPSALRYYRDQRPT